MKISAELRETLLKELQNAFLAAFEKIGVERIKGLDWFAGNTRAFEEDDE